jgi:hypothetical protein
LVPACRDTIYCVVVESDQLCGTQSDRIQCVLYRIVLCGRRWPLGTTVVVLCVHRCRVWWCCVCTCGPCGCNVPRVGAMCALVYRAAVMCANVSYVGLPSMQCVGGHQAVTAALSYRACFLKASVLCVFVVAVASWPTVV